jgi:phosphoglycolate phosphatase-like HAD superfamily hydrolase
MFLTGFPGNCSTDSYALTACANDFGFAAPDLGFKPESAVVIGDKESDVGFGRSAGATTIRIAAHGPCEPGGVRADFVAANLLEAAQIITS